MLSPVKVIDIELSQPWPTIEDLASYLSVQGLVRLYGVPLGYVKLPISNGRCRAATIAHKVLEQYNWTILRQHLNHALWRNCLTLDGNAINEANQSFDIAKLLPLPPAKISMPLPSVTVAVCTRDHPADLAICLDSLVPIDFPGLEILVVDNAPSSDATALLVAERYPQVRYVCEPRPGLDWARNRAIIEAQNEIIAYADDDVVADAGWVAAIAEAFADSPEVMAVTGLVVPYELETDAQVMFELNGGFGRGFERRRFYVAKGEPMPWNLMGTGNCGTGANMAYRRSVFQTIGGFDPALDVGTVTNGAGDLEMFFRILVEGHVLVYEPSAIIRHRHRREYAKLKSQLQNNGSVFSYLICAVKAYPHLWRGLLKLGLWYFGSYHLRRAVMLSTHPNRLPRDLVWAEIKGCLIGLGRYGQATKNAGELAHKFLPELRSQEHQALFPPAFLPKSQRPPAPLSPPYVTSRRNESAIAVRVVELTEPLQPITDVSDYRFVRLFVNHRGLSQGSVDFYNQYQPIQLLDLLQTITHNFAHQLPWIDRVLDSNSRFNLVAQALQQYYMPPELQAQVGVPEALPPNVSVSVVLATYDRPESLRDSLTALTQLITARPVEVIVVDNHPQSGLTPPIVAEFPGFRLVKESRAGLAYARNAGITASQGDIIVATDDDVIMPPEWLEKLLEPFVRSDVMAVTGNTLPIEIESSPQKFFEDYGGLGRGFRSFTVDRDWFERSWRYLAPTWEIGATANAAFRATIFKHPEIGLMNEALGPGMPSGVGEDIYLFYKILKAGYTIAYQSNAQVWHRHRSTMAALRRQLYNYSKGFICYNLTTWLQDGDLRPLTHLGGTLPAYHLKRIGDRLRGRSHYPIRLVLLEIAGNLMGPLCLWLSYRRVKREGRSSPYGSTQAVDLVEPISPALIRSESH
jgi:O-antigen biosynthesis protein